VISNPVSVPSEVHILGSVASDVASLYWMGSGKVKLIVFNLWFFFEV
jgi:hypothetical protein